MEFESLSEKIEWEARRVVTAFEAREYKSWGQRNPIDTIPFASSLGGCPLWFYLHADTSTLVFIEIGNGQPTGMGCRVWSENRPNTWYFYPCKMHHQLMARGLYRLGFEDEGVLAQLPALTAHEKLELRLSMPREFWPQKWLDEDVGLDA